MQCSRDRGRVALRIGESRDLAFQLGITPMDTVSSSVTGNLVGCIHDTCELCYSGKSTSTGYPYVSMSSSNFRTTLSQQFPCSYIIPKISLLYLVKCQLSSTPKTCGTISDGLRAEALDNADDDKSPWSSGVGIRSTDAKEEPAPQGKTSPLTLNDHGSHQSKK